MLIHSHVGHHLIPSLFVCSWPNIHHMARANSLDEEAHKPVQKKINYQIWCNTAFNIFRIVRITFDSKKPLSDAVFIYFNITKPALSCCLFPRPRREMMISCCGVYGSKKHVNISSVYDRTPPQDAEALCQMPPGNSIN